jgi:hypothetical protein
VSEQFPQSGRVTIETTATNDLRSYRVDSEKAARVLGFRARHTIEDAVVDLCDAFRVQRFAAAPDDERYNNVLLMKNRNLAAELVAS